MVDLGVLPAFLLAAVAICLAPGPDQAFIIASASAGGRRAGVLASVGMAIGIAVHTTAAALGLAAVLGTSPTALQVVRIVGAMYLAYLAVMTFRALREGTGAEEGAEAASGDQMTALRRGLLVNLTNPKIILFFASFLPHFLGQATSFTAQFLMLGAAFLVVGLVIDSAIGLMAGHLRESSSSGRTRTGLTLLAGSTYAVLSTLLVVESV